MRTRLLLLLIVASLLWVACSASISLQPDDSVMWTSSNEGLSDLGVVADEGTTWSIDVAAFVEIGRAEVERQPGVTGRCLAIVGTATPLEIPDGLLISPPHQAPSFAVETDQGVVEAGFDTCGAYDLLNDAGYGGPTIYVMPTVGTEHPFYTTAIVPDTWTVQSIRLGDPFEDPHVVRIDVDVTSPFSIPHAEQKGALDADTISLGKPITHRLGNSIWTIEVRGVTEVNNDAREPDKLPGRCYAIYGFMRLEEAYGIPVDVPHMATITDGEYRGGDAFTGSGSTRWCDQEPAASAGYVEQYNTSIIFEEPLQWPTTEGLPFPFAITTYVGSSSDPDAIVVLPAGNWLDPGWVLYEAKLSSKIE